MSDAGPQANTLREVVLITGISGSGKSVALHALEDAGYFCVDNLPPELIESFVTLEHSRFTPRVAIAADVRSARSLPHLLPAMAKLRDSGVTVRSVFLDASTDTLVRRFSETRRRHPLSDGASEQGDAHHALIEAIELERELLSDLRQTSTVVDTSELRPAQLRSWIKNVVQAPAAKLTLVFESFAFKRGIPMDADFVFDVRMLPNPHYEPDLRPLTGRDEPVTAFLARHAEVTAMQEQIDTFLRHWLPHMLDDHRSYVTVAIGCTGGQHRSVYLVERLAKAFSSAWSTRLRHREIDGWPTPPARSASASP